MEWIIGALIGVFTIGIQFYIWVWPRLQRNAAEKKEAKLKMKGGLEIAIKEAKEYRGFGLGEFGGIIADSRIPQKLRREVRELIGFATECRDWRYESWQVVNTQVKLLARSDEFKKLDKEFKLFDKTLQEEFYGYDGTPSERIYQAIYDGNLTFELARNAILHNRWGEEKKVNDGVMKFKDVIESGQFHKFIEELKQLQERRSLKMLRSARERLTENAQLILKETT